jgi:hypothetical protein
MVIKIPGFETSEKFNRYTKSLFKLFWAAEHAARPATVAVSLFPPLSLAAVTPRATSGQGTARSLSAALKESDESI